MLPCARLRVCVIARAAPELYATIAASDVTVVATSGIAVNDVMVVVSLAPLRGAYATIMVTIAVGNSLRKFRGLGAGCVHLSPLVSTCRQL